MPDNETQVDETTTTTENGATTETGKDGKPFDADRAQRLIDQQREEIKALKATSKELADARARLKEIEDKDKSETERAASRAQEAEAKLSAAEQRAADLALQMAVERAARKLNFIDEDDAFRLLDRKAVEMDADGEPANVEKLLTTLAKAKPHLVKDEDAGTANGTGARTQAVPGTPRPNSGRPTDRTQADIEGLRATGRYSV
jgi:chromosome segregation ATPase